MPKYRLLTHEELHEFEKEFVDFLVVNGIEPERWELIKAEDTESMNKIIELFSDVILESVLRKVKYVDFRSKQYVHAVSCMDDKMIGIVLEDSVKDHQTAGSETSRESGLSIYRSEKKYASNRESEIFELLQKGYQISNGDLYKKLEKASSN